MFSTNQQGFFQNSTSDKMMGFEFVVFMNMVVL